MNVPETEQAEDDARVQEMVFAHLRAVGVSDAEQQASAFVERLRVGRVETPPANDARLFGQTVSGLSSLPDQQPLIVARQLIAILRRVRFLDQRTWAPGDALPSPPPAKMADLDWDEWLHQDKAGNGCYRMSAKDRRRNASSTHDYEGVQVWPFLLEGEGPFTEVTSSRR